MSGGAVKRRLDDGDSDGETTGRRPQPTSSRVEQGFVHQGPGTLHASNTFNNFHGQSAPRRTLQQELRFPSMGQREHQVRRADPDTCEWIFKTKAFQEWEASCNTGPPRSRLLCITGKAGSGKSVALRNAIKRAQGKSGAGGAECLILSHFFDARGEKLEKSTEGMYRTLLVEFFREIPDLEELLAGEVGAWMPSEGQPWPLPLLEELLETSVKALGGREVIFYVDALDKCRDESIQEMMHVFERLVKVATSHRQSLRICFTSRPIIHDVDEKVIYLSLAGHKEHGEDIERYLNAHLHIGRGQRALDVRNKIMKRHSHVFLWVKIVVDKLNKEHPAGQPQNYEKWLTGSHGDLHSLYEEMIKPADEDENHEEVKGCQRICFQWLHFAKDSFRNKSRTAKAMWWMMKLSSGRADVEAIVRESEGMAHDDFERHVLWISKGLVEGNKHSPGSATIHFIHESAQAFALDQLRKSSGRDHLDLNEVIPVLEGQLALLRCYEKLLDACKKPIDDLLVDGEVSYQRTEALFKRYHVIRYIGESILSHADDIQKRSENGMYDRGSWLAQFYANHKAGYGF
ncbi:Pfs, NB-ARC and Ankyrin domain protein [Sarocladium implicatum]|nr:Pfs, NB-ARC and Ankyrin domain protein [Sarocladium implicatum]